jgi:copper homeostasis protein
MRTLEDAIQLGCKTILTSGQQKDALTGVELLRELYDRANGRIDIMAGCGVKKWNIREIHDRAGLVVFHTTGRKDALDSGMRYRKQTVAMGLPSLSEYEIWQTDEEEFRACAEIVHSFAGAGA